MHMPLEFRSEFVEKLPLMKEWFLYGSALELMNLSNWLLHKQQPLNILGRNLTGKKADAIKERVFQMDTVQEIEMYLDECIKEYQENLC